MRRSRSPEMQTDNNSGPAWREVGSNKIPEHYATMDLEPTATDKEIQTQYKKLALKFHPDRLHQQQATAATVGDPKERFQQIQKAYAVLGNTKARAEYDAKFGLNLHRRVEVLMSGLKDKTSSSSNATGSVYVPVPTQIISGEGKGDVVDHDKKEESDEDYVPSPRGTGAGLSSSASEKKEQKSGEHKKVAFEVDAEWADLF